ncbi:19585_t:CDS:2, partial [Racocetra fulgida]
MDPKQNEKSDETIDQKQGEEPNETTDQKPNEKQTEENDYGIEKIDTAKTVFNGVGTITEIFKPFVPYIDIILGAANAIIKIYEDAKYNKNICLVFVERMRIAKFIIERLTTSKESNIEMFQNQSFLDALVKFSNIVRSIKKFVLDISQMNQRKRFFNATEIKGTIDKLRQDFNDAMNDLQFSIIANQMIDKAEEDRKIERDLDTMQQYLEKILECVETTVEQVQKIAIANEVLNNDSKSNIWNTFKAPQIDSREITDPKRGASHGKVVKKVYLALNVACKPFEILNNNSPQSHKQQETTYIDNPIEMFPWMAPEKMKGDPYTHKCEKVPYEKITSKQSIRDFVMKGNREVFESRHGPSYVPKAFTKIIDYGNPIERPNFQVLLEELEKLCKKYDSTSMDNSTFEIVEENNDSESEGTINLT